jgi:hypothetical protein
VRETQGRLIGWEMTVAFIIILVMVPQLTIVFDKGSPTLE